MDIRYSVNQRDFKRYTTQEIRDEFLIETVFEPDRITAVYSHVDRMIAMGAMPVEKKLCLEDAADVKKDLGVEFFLANRELGIINIAGSGRVILDGEAKELGHLDCLYVSRGTKTVEFEACDPKEPPKFYMCSAPAHREYPTRLISYEMANHRHIGALETSNERTVNQYIHPDVLDTCQLSMGLTQLEPGSVWNTMPSHTHERRMEVYFYFDIEPGQVVAHFMGEPGETRHVFMQNEQAVISPSWSIHSGCGTKNYTFIWAMAGENRVFDDMDTFPNTDLK